MHWYSWQILGISYSLSVFITWLIFRSKIRFADSRFTGRYSRGLILAVGVISFLLGLAVGDVAKQDQKVKAATTYAAGYQVPADDTQGDGQK